MTKTHDLKIEDHFYDRLISGEKTCEVRKNDRDFQRGDYITFPDKALSTWEITHVQALSDVPGLERWLECDHDDYVVLSLKQIQ